MQQFTDLHTTTSAKEAQAFLKVPGWHLIKPRPDHPEDDPNEFVLGWEYAGQAVEYPQGIKRPLT